MVCIFLPPEEAFRCTAEEYGDARLDRCRAFVPVLNLRVRSCIVGLLAWTFGY